MLDNDLGEIGVGDIVFGRKNEIGLVILVKDIRGGRIFGRVVNGQYPVAFAVSTGSEAVERRSLPDAPPDVNPFYTAIMRGDWADGMRITSAARLPEQMIRDIKRLDAMMDKATYSECLELMKEHGAVIGDAIAIFNAAEDAEPVPGMR